MLTSQGTLTCNFRLLSLQAIEKITFFIWIYLYSFLKIAAKVYDILFPERMNITEITLIFLEQSLSQTTLVHKLWNCKGYLKEKVFLSIMYKDINLLMTHFNYYFRYRNEQFLLNIAFTSLLLTVTAKFEHIQEWWYPWKYRGLWERTENTHFFMRLKGMRRSGQFEDEIKKF